VSIRFLADADLNQAIVAGALGRETTLDFLTAAEADLTGRNDPDVLEYAASQDRILVSHDTSTMPVHFADRLRSGRMSPGVFLVRQRAAVGEVIEAILLVWSASDRENGRDRFTISRRLRATTFAKGFGGLPSLANRRAHLTTDSFRSYCINFVIECRNRESCIGVRTRRTGISIPA
jgi:hypothetical protein